MLASSFVGFVPLVRVSIVKRCANIQTVTFILYKFFLKLAQINLEIFYLFFGQNCGHFSWQSVDTVDDIGQKVLKFYYSVRMTAFHDSKIQFQKKLALIIEERRHKFIFRTSMPDVLYVVFYNVMYMSSFSFMWLLTRCGYQLRFLLYNTCKTKADIFFCCIHWAIWCLKYCYFRHCQGFLISRKTCYLVT